MEGFEEAIKMVEQGRETLCGRRTHSLSPWYKKLSGYGGAGLPMAGLEGSDRLLKKLS